MSVIGSSSEFISAAEAGGARASWICPGGAFLLKIVVITGNAAIVMKSIKGLLLVGMLALCAGAAPAGEIERFLALDQDALRAAERRLPELYDRSTGRVLAEPGNEAERYVIDRERRWLARKQRETRVRVRQDGVAILEHDPALMSTTWLVVDASGHPGLQCGSASPHSPRRDLRRRSAEPQAVVR